MGLKQRKSKNRKKSKKMKFLIIIFGIFSSSAKAQSQESACDQLFAQQLKVTPNPCSDRTFAGKCRQKCPETIFGALPRSATELCMDAFSFCGPFFSALPCNSPAMANNREKYYDDCPVACGNPDCIAPVTPEPATTTKPMQDSSCTDASKHCNALIM